MGFFNRKNKEETTTANLSEQDIYIFPSNKSVTITADTTPEIKEEEEWVWVEGYKGLDHNMMGYGGFQYELSTIYSMPKNEVSLCSSGYHLCLNLCDVFEYYNVCNGNRFFKVKALVNKKDLDKYHSFGKVRLRGYSLNIVNKLAACELIFLEEVDKQTIIDTYYEYCEEDFKLPAEYNDIIIQKNYPDARKDFIKNQLESFGFCSTLSLIISKDLRLAERALTIGGQQDLSMDMKVWYIFK